KEEAEKIVIKNTHQINQMIEEVSPLQDKLYTPSIEGADEEVRELTYQTAKSIYGEQLPEIVTERLEKELESIIGHGFAVIYLISHKLVKQSLNDGYLVGSRGSVGSSLVATMTEITEVNPLPAHMYVNLVIIMNFLQTVLMRVDLIYLIKSVLLVLKILRKMDKIFRLKHS